METNKVELIQELKSYLDKNRHCLTGDEVKLLNRVIEELKKVDDRSANFNDSLLSVVRVTELIMKLFEMN